jgi:mono/diheme cytochrome c family protein
MSRAFGAIGAVLAALAASAAFPAGAQTPAERGRYLVESIVACGNCHTPKNPDGSERRDMNLAGGFIIEAPPFTAVASNITPDRETGIGQWTDQQIVRAIREGIRPDGSIIGPPMPFEFYGKISDRDAMDIVAYLREAPAVKNRTAKSFYRIPLPKSWGNAAADPDPQHATDKVAYGAYLAGPLGHCLECHTPMLPSGGRDMARVGAGGPPIPGPAGDVVPPNITPDAETGIGRWSDGEIKRAITQGISRDGRKLMPPMAFAYYARMTPRDLDAIVAYLRSLKPLPAQR